MADPLSQLRQFHINGREIKEHNGYIIFGDHGWPKTVNTNYQVYSTDNDKNKKEYYTLECLLYFIKNMDVAHHHYVKQAGRDNIPCVHRPDRKNLLAYLKGEQQTSSGIDKNAPIPPLRLPVSEIYKKDHHGTTSDSMHNSGSPIAGPSGQQDGTSRSNDPNSAGAKKRHDPELEKKYREEFAARLYAGDKTKPLLPQDTVDKANDTSTEASAAISKFGAEKLAAMRAKHLAVKRTTIVDADTDTKPTGAAGDATNKEAELLIAMDEDPSRIIKSKEKVWRTRTSILQAQSKNFQKTVLPFVDLMAKMDDPNRKQGNPNLPVPADVQMSAYPHHHAHHPPPPPTHHSQQQMHRNTYNRYDQERFVKLDIGVEIDTKKSFVSGVASNGISSYSQQRPPGGAVTPTGTPQRGAIGGPPPTAPHHHAPTSWHSGGAGHNNGSVPRPIDGVDSGNHHHHLSRSRPSKRQSTVPIIIIPNIPSSIINISNAAALLQDLTFVKGSDNGVRAEETLIQRKKPDGTHVAYKILANPIKLEAEDWNRVVAVFVHGPAWQFKGWPWDGSPVEIFSRIKGFHLRYDDSRLDDNVAKWNVTTLEISKTKRHLDKAILMKFWAVLDQFMIKYKSGYLKL